MGSKTYASCSEVLRKLATCGFWVGGFKENHTLCGCIQGSKTTNKLQRRYVKQQQAIDDQRVPGLKCNKQCTLVVSCRTTKFEEHTLM